EDLAKRVRRCGGIEHSASIELVEQIPRSNDWPGHEVGEKENERKIAHRIVDCVELPAIHIDRVAERLKGIKTDPHRKDDLQGHRRSVQPEQRAETSERIGEEIEVFEGGEDAQIRQERQQDPRASLPLVLLFFEGEADSEV